MDIKITYFDFANIDKFASLIQQFQAYDERNVNVENNLDNIQELVKATCEFDLKITYRSDIGEYVEKSFFIDFLIPKIDENEPFNEYTNYINKKIENEFKYKIPERRLFIQDEINKLENLLLKVDKEPYIKIHYSKPLYNQIEQSIEMLYDDESRFEAKDDSQKIKVKLLRSELTCLFYLLRQAGYIDHKYDSDLGKLLEQNFLYFNAEENSYKELTNINKLLSDMGNGHKPINTASETLKKILSKPEFYELKP